MGSSSRRRAAASASDMQHVILGAGPAGVIAAETIRKHAPNDRITLVGDEPEAPYSRMAIPYLLIGKVGEDGTWLRHTPGHFEQLGIQVRRNRAVKVDSAAKTAVLELENTSDALGRVLAAVSPDGSVTRYAYDEGGALQRVTLNHRGAAQAQTVIGEIEHDAKGRRTRVVYGPADAPTSTTRYTYDALSGRLLRLRTRQRLVVDLPLRLLVVGLLVIDELLALILLGSRLVISLGGSGLVTASSRRSRRRGRA